MQRELHELVRYRRSVVKERSREANRLQKVLKGGSRFLRREQLTHIEELDARLGRLNAEIETRRPPLLLTLKLLQTIPRVGRLGRRVACAEVSKSTFLAAGGEVVRREQDHLRRGYVEVEGARLYCEERGSGPAIVFVHGWGLDLSYWLPVMKLLSRRYRTIAYDARGAGRSSGALPPYPLARLVEDLSAVIRHFGLVRPVLCGHSLGGDTVLQHGVTYPQAARKLVVADSPGPYDFWTSRLSYFGFKVILAIADCLGVDPPQKPLMGLFRDLLWSKDFQDW